jgi:amino acid transporter
VDQAATRASDALDTRTSDREAQRIFSWSIVISGIRCLIAYILLPFFLPFLGLSPSVGPWLGIVIGLVAIAANVFSIRRFARSTHRLRKLVIGINIAVIGLLLVLLVMDLNAVF